MGRPAKRPPQTEEEMEQSLTERKTGSSVYRKSDTLAANEERIKNITLLTAAGLANVATPGARVQLSDTATVQEITLNYTKTCAEYSVIPSISGLAKALGMTRQALHDHVKRHPDDPTSEWIKEVSDSFGQILMDAAVSGVVAPIPAIYATKARYGWSDHDATDLSEIEGKQKVDAKAIIEKYQNLSLPD